MATPHNIDQWLQQGIAAAKAGQHERARFLLLDVVEQQQTNEAAWYWLYRVFDTIEDKRICLENLILINPENLWAKKTLLDILENASAPAEAQSLPAKPKAARAPAKKAERPLTLKLVSAFWLGISIIFLSGGIISAVEWLTYIPHNRNIIIFQSFNLLIAVVFLIIGLSELVVAVSLFLRSMWGFYGSILLSLVLLLIGPTVSLITTPPNYVAMVCTGGISGMIVLLTLASQSGFENFSQNDNH